MRNDLLFLLLFLFCFTACSEKEQPASKQQQAIEEIKQAEHDFAEMSVKRGIKKAFVAFCADSARIRSADTVIAGKLSIEKYYSQSFFKSASLNWKADYIDAGDGGDMGYTYGHYTLTVPGINGKKMLRKGIFHTVWKKKNGKWKFVWDG